MNGAEGQTLLAISHLDLAASTAAWGVATAVGLGVTAGLLPAWGAYRAKVTEMLRSV